MPRDLDPVGLAVINDELDRARRYRRALKIAVRCVTQHAQARAEAGDAVQPFGYVLARRVLNSDLYPQLNESERAECNALALAGDPTRRNGT